MIYKLLPSTSDLLLKSPETGMGYQVIDARRQNKYMNERFIVYNSELILDYDSNFKSYRAQILTEGYSSIYNKSSYLSLENIKILQISDIKETRTILASKRESKLRHSGGKGAKENPKISANGEDYFVRLSAFENDKRIDFEKKCLKSGTYTTNLRDYLTCVQSNDNPIDRYALPNDDKINWAFYIKPDKGESYQEGIVQPAFGHDGGGIEDYFENGTHPNTYKGKLAYGKFEN
jgi:hypothetical protein